MTKQPFYTKHMKRYANILKDSNAKLAHEQGLYFGNNPELTNKEINKIIALFSR